MTDFTFNTTKSILSQRGATDQLGDFCTPLMSAPVLVVTDPGLIKLGLLENALTSLKKCGLEPLVFSDISADPPVKNVTDVIALGKSHNVKGVIGFGGGSSMDVAKLAAYLLKNNEKLEEIYGVGMAKGERLPLVQIPTTAGTGSEVTPISIVTTGENEKMGVVSPPLLPDLAILDANLTIGLPPHVSAATGVDAMVHAIEAYTSRYKKNPISDALAKEALRLLSNNIDIAVHHGNNVEARENMILGSMLAGQAFANAPVAAVHALAYPIGGHFHVAHGLSNSLVLPHVMRFNLPAADKLYAELAPIILPKAPEGTNRSKAEALIDHLEQLIPRLGLQTKLREVGITRDHLTMMSEDAMKQTRLLVNNPIELTKEDVYNIYLKAL